MNKLGVATGLVLAGLTTAAQDPGYIPPHGFVPDSITATRIAEAVLLPIYGAQVVSAERPLVARLSGGTWTVTGSLPKGRAGGTATVKISQHDGRILYVWHSK